MADDDEGVVPAPHSHLIAFPEALEAFFTRVGELRMVLGPRAAGGLPAFEALLRDGLAARDRGDPANAVRCIVAAMRRLAELASMSDAAEAPMLRAAAEQFAAALGRGSVGEAKEAAEHMRARSGSTVVPRSR